MFIRRIIFLFVLFALIAAGLIFRLGQLQLVQAHQFQQQARNLIKRHALIETSRGAILDRNGRVLAQDEPCYDLAIDYRAMNEDDRWITAQAITRLKTENLPDRKARRQRLAEIKADIARQIEAIPTAIAQACGVPLEEVLEREEAIRERIYALREGQLSSGKYNRSQDAINIADGLIDPDMDIDLREEAAAHTVIPAVPKDIMFTLDKVLDQYPGLKRIDSKQRIYPYGAVAAHVIGAMMSVDRATYIRDPLPRLDRVDQLDDEPGDLHGYLPGDDMGAFGIERMAESSLRGSRGVRLMEVGGDEMNDQRRDAAPGRDVHTTLDIELQKELTATFLDPSKGLLKGQDETDTSDHNVALIIMAMDGEVLSMISIPTYDLNTYHENAVALAHDETHRPLLNRAAAGAYPPGSTVKPLVATAALTEGVVTPSETIICNGHLFPNAPLAYRCTAVHGPISLANALEESCNVYFYTMGMRLGLDRLTHWYADFGFGTSPGLGLPDEIRGTIPNLAKLTDHDVAAREAIQIGIGQGSLTVSPLQMACAYATLLRGGVKVQPRIFLDQKSQVTGRMVIPPDALENVRRGMELVVNGSRGTARGIFKSGLSIAGKTGTATATRTLVAPDGTRTQKEDSDAWFVGYAPVDQPRFIVAAIMEFGGHGGKRAAPLANEALLALTRHGYLPPSE